MILFFYGYITGHFIISPLHKGTFTPRMPVVFFSLHLKAPPPASIQARTLRRMLLYPPLTSCFSREVLLLLHSGDKLQSGQGLSHSSTRHTGLSQRSRGDRSSCTGGPKAPLQQCGPKGLLRPPADHTLVVQAVTTSWCYWLQQDGTTAHTAIRVREWLEGKSVTG